jgi:hypothetical protein
MSVAKLIDEYGCATLLPALGAMLVANGNRAPQDCG